MDLHIEHIGGFCPVQAEGTVNGIPFYFRSRGEHWAMAVGEDPLGILLGEMGWFRRERYGDFPSAGYMPLEEAEVIIRRCAEEFIKEEPS